VMLPERLKVTNHGSINKHTIVSYF